MVTRDITGIVDRSRIDDQPLTIDRYDLLLGLIPTAFMVAFLASRLLSLPFEAAVLGGAAIAALALFDGVFFRPPTGLRGT